MSDALKAQNWKPWTLNDLAAREKVVMPELTVEDIATPKDVVTFTEDDLAELRAKVEQKAHQSGFTQGQKEGYSAGFQTGQDEGRQQALEEIRQQQAPLVAQLQQMVTEFQHTLDAMDSVIPSRLMQLALTAAKQVIGQAPICDGTALLAQIQQLLEQEPLLKGNPVLRVSPANLALIEEKLGATLATNGWTLLADSQLHAGGCKITADDGEIDASLATRWHELCRLAAPGEL